MLNFQLASGAYDYRPLKLDNRGWDVYALQTALNGMGHLLNLDGVFWFDTERSVKLWQEGRGLVVDGIAGILTQRSLALVNGEGARMRAILPIKLLMGQIEKESGYELGNHTAPYKDGSRDLGVAQRNDKQQRITYDQAFHVPNSLEVLSQTVRLRHDRYLSAPLREGFKRVSNERAWHLAAGSWNRPAHAAYLAGMRTNDPVTPSTLMLTTEQREWIEGYIDRVCTYADAYYGTRMWPS